MVSHPVFDRLAPEMKSYCYAEEVEISNFFGGVFGWKFCEVDLELNAGMDL